MAQYRHKRKRKQTAPKALIIAAVAAVAALIAVCIIITGSKNRAPDAEGTDRQTDVTPEVTENVTEPQTGPKTEKPTEKASDEPTEAPAEPPTEAPTEAPVTTIDYPGVGRTEKVETDPPVTDAPVTDAPVTDAPAPPPPSGTYEPSENGYAMLKKSVFVGDSICSGLRAFGVLPEENVCATGSVSACNIFWYGKFNVNGVEYGIEDALKNWYIDPEAIIFSMGMNDVNMGSEQYFTDNYKALIDAVRAVKPNAKLAVCSVTPVSAESTFAANSKIDRYNAALKAFCDGYGVTFVDVSMLLKDAKGDLVSTYHSGDGIHLMPDSYRIMLYSVCRAMGWQ